MTAPPVQEGYEVAVQGWAMNYALTEMNFGDEGRVITALPLRYLYLGDTWGSGKIHVLNLLKF
jgi:hypothetical protein